MAATTTITSPADIAAALRSRVLHLRPEDIGFNRIAESPTVWGVVIETAHPDATASCIVLADGSVSLYVSDGTGMIGCGGQRDVRAAGAELLQIAAKSLPLTNASDNASDDLASPPEGYVRFYLLTRAARRFVQARLEEINRIDERLSVLYFSGQRLLALIERVGAGQSLAQEIRLALHGIDNDSGGSHARAVTCIKDHPRLSTEGDEQCLSVGNVVRRLRT